jgi:hypothetical protein
MSVSAWVGFFGLPFPLVSRTLWACRRSAFSPARSAVRSFRRCRKASNTAAASRFDIRARVGVRVARRLSFSGKGLSGSRSRACYQISPSRSPHAGSNGHAWASRSRKASGPCATR